MVVNVQQFLSLVLEIGKWSASRLGKISWFYFKRVMEARNISNLVKKRNIHIRERIRTQVIQPVACNLLRFF
jgi:hypothetical protein